MTPEKYAKTESERMEGAKTAQSKTVYKANEPRGYPSGKCQREAANEVSTRIHEVRISERTENTNRKTCRWSMAEV